MPSASHVILAATAGYFLYQIVAAGASWISPRSKPTTDDVEDDEPIVIRNYTPLELAEFDGRRSRKIFMAVKGRVFDVSRGASFYGPDGAYGNFAGRDASRGLAKHSFELDMLMPLDQPIDTLADLSADERDSLNDWFGHFSMKYPHVGFLVNPAPVATTTDW
ncbi:membrane-associated progesterone receptor component 1 [Blastocladiella britannica]|nr:membrane-associated progesterone receptor component 1 [Blastocladiella britannica]